MCWQVVYALVIRASGTCFMPYNGLHMLPNLKILIGGVVFALFLFAVTGTGVLLPESYTRVGEMPEIGRPMMQRMIADEPAQAQFHIMTVARRSEELDRLRERSARDVAPAQPESDLLKPAVVENPVTDNILTTDAAAPALQSSAATGIAPGTASLQGRPTEIETDVAPDNGQPVQVAALSPTSADADLTERAPSVLQVPLPPQRPAARTSVIPRRVLHWKNQATQPPSDTVGQSPFPWPFLQPR